MSYVRCPELDKITGQKHEIFLKNIKNGCKKPFLNVKAENFKN